MPPASSSAITTGAALLEHLGRLRLLETSQLDELKEQDGAAPAEQLAGLLIQRGWLTPYQCDTIFQGKGDELRLGNFVLLEKLGQGGMGTIYKARADAGGLVAVKVLRPERLGSVEAVRRFYREVRIAAKLAHPNVMPALDADQIGDRHFFTMEYLEGIDLDRLVHERGPLPVGRACNYLKQAALGLQHAHEHGLVHRDIKPSNLFVTAQPAPAAGGTRRHDPPGQEQPARQEAGGVRKGGVIKLLDLGLARVNTGETSEQVLTKQGFVMGSLDFIAPEQTLDSHHVDIRADLYSLGCTFYFALTGQVPFPGGGPAIKLMNHRKDEPRRLEELRPEVPAEVADIIRKLMTKKAALRFQLPSELAAAVAAVIKQLALVDDEAEDVPTAPENAEQAGAPTVWYHKSPTTTGASVAEPLPTPEESGQAAAAPPTAAGPEPAQLPDPEQPPAPERRLTLALVAGGILLFGALYIAWKVFG